MRSPVILCESSGVIAIAKPAGIATQAPPGIESVEAWLRRHLHGAADRGYIGVPHRLDRAVSGVLLMTATPRAARKLSRQFERREIGKAYLAIVECRGAAAGAAWPPADDAPDRWCDLVEKVPDEPRARLAAADSPTAREAVTTARLLARQPTVGAAGRLVLELEPLTGRMHQLRLQAASRGMPIVGDGLYGDPADAGWCHADGAEFREPPIALHAVRIRYADPDTGRESVVEAPLPDYWPAVSHC